MSGGRISTTVFSAIVAGLTAMVGSLVVGSYAEKQGHHRGYLDGRVSMTRCAHGAAKVVDDKVACVEVRP